MRIYWWNNGLHLAPDNQEEHTALVGLSEVLRKAGKIEVGPKPGVTDGSHHYLEELLARNVVDRDVRDGIQADDE